MVVFLLAVIRIGALTTVSIVSRAVWCNLKYPNFLSFSTLRALAQVWLGVLWFVVVRVQAFRWGGRKGESREAKFLKLRPFYLEGSIEASPEPRLRHVLPYK